MMAAMDFMDLFILSLVLTLQRNKIIPHPPHSKLKLLLLRSNQTNMSNARKILNNEEDRRVVEAIKQAELNTSGEIKVHIENFCKTKVEKRALFIFNRLKMNKTQQRNGVLFYLAVKEHKFAILGDEGINNVVEPDFWTDIRDLMVAEFKEGHFAEGLEQGIMRCGEKLKTYFPYQTDDINEIPDEISYENN